MSDEHEEQVLREDIMRMIHLFVLNEAEESDRIYLNETRKTNYRKNVEELTVALINLIRQCSHTPYA